MSRVVVAGSHDAGIPKEIVWEAIRKSGFEITEEGCGMAKEVDTYGMEWAKKNRIPIRKFYAPWRAYGRNAGPMRNGAMAEWCHRLILVWNNSSDGSADMRRKAILRKRPIYEVCWWDGAILYQGHLGPNGERG